MQLASQASASMGHVHGYVVLSGVVNPVNQTSQPKRLSPSSKLCATEAQDLTISEQEQCLSILSAIRATLADARPSALKSQLEEVLNDGE